MASDFIRVGTGAKLAADTVTATIGSNQHQVARQHVVAVQPLDAAQIGFPVAQLLDQHLVEAGAGSADMNVNGAVTAVAFAYTVPATKGALVEEVVLWLRDAGGVFTGVTFGGIAALTTGLKIEVYDDASTPALVATVLATAKDHGDILRAGAELDNAAAMFADCLRFRFRLARAGAALYLPAGYSVRATVADDLSGLDELRATVIGRVL